MDEVVEALEKYQGLVPLVYDVETMGLVEARPQDMPYAVYLKREADKVIADLKADYKEACDRLQTANLIKDEQLAATSHSKRKRCLAMAEWCEERCARYDLLQEHSGFSFRREIDFYFRWHKRWLELAKKFKPNKEAK